jgi:hypothetical protein
VEIREYTNKPLQEIIKNYFVFLHEIEINLISKNKTKGKRPEIFQSIRRYSNFDYYGEDLLMEFFSDAVMGNIEDFLEELDVTNLKFPSVE